ncbi:MAG: hypothetical protein ACJ78D_05310 [Gemmatimonadaceae bacterium]
MSITPLYVVGIAAVVSCTPSSITPGVRQNPNLITQDEVVATQATNALEVITRLRPKFLNSRGRSTINSTRSDYPVVFLDGQFYGQLPLLEQIVATDILEIRFVPGTDAAALYGMQYGSGVIAIRTRR